MDQSEITNQARVAAAEALGADKLTEIIRAAYAADQRELTPMRPVRRDPQSDLMLDNRERAADMRGAR